MRIKHTNSLYSEANKTSWQKFCEPRDIVLLEIQSEKYKHIYTVCIVQIVWTKSIMYNSMKMHLCNAKRRLSMWWSSRPCAAVDAVKSWHNHTHTHIYRLIYVLWSQNTTYWLLNIIIYTGSLNEYNTAIIKIIYGRTKTLHYPMRSFVRHNVLAQKNNNYS